MAKVSSLFVVALFLCAHSTAASEKHCIPEEFFLPFDDLPNDRGDAYEGYKPAFGDTYSGGVHVAAYNKGNDDDLYDDAILCKNGKTKLQLCASRDILRDLPEATHAGSVFHFGFDEPVMAIQILLLDTDNDPKSYVHYDNFGKIILIGHFGEIRTIELPQNTRTGQYLRTPTKLVLEDQVGYLVDLGGTPGVIEMIIDTGDGAWKAVDRFKFQKDCQAKLYGTNQEYLVRHPFSFLNDKTRNYLIRKSMEDGTFREKFPACVGNPVADCKAAIQAACPECHINTGQPPKTLRFYRIAIKFDEKGKVVGIPQRG